MVVVGGGFMQWSVKRKKRAGWMEGGRKSRRSQKLHFTFTKCFRASHPTLVIESAPRLWHKGVGKANHVVETREEKRRRAGERGEEREKRREEKRRTGHE